ncbi:hypothetical protein C161_27198 [Paenibacillus sp. FSL R5-192]|uniref:hypothetical protein n=1 Tax=Paenibacillus sp. FSL R5-192 TaxID=1226754 RepID=UPI0003E1C5A9|nr:hypothetical protein [Paenibacillus sp. FSL R5-192]ETT30662.1 hypothetical protein C161_27198 [Paenibacillus sp. FSL R5-192]
MNEFEKFLVPYGVPNIIIVNKLNNEESVLYAVDSKGENALIGSVQMKNTKDWFKDCELVTKKMLLEKFRLRM